MNIKIILYIIYAIVKYRYWIDPRIIYAQFWHETGGFKSDIFKENNNVCGMKKNSRSYDIGFNRGHAVYSSVIDSVKDFFERQIQFKVAPADAYSYLSETQETGYAEDPKYIERVLNVLDQQKSRLNTFFMVALPLVIVIPLGIFLLIKRYVI